MTNSLNKQLSLLTCLIVFMIAVFTPHSAAALEQSPLYSVGLGFEFASGTYGTGVRTESVIAPVTLAMTPTDRIGVSVEVPFVYQSNGGVISQLGHTMIMGVAMQSPSPGMMGGGGAGGMPGMSGMTASPGAVSGLGDVTVKGAYVLVAEKAFVPQVRPGIFIKIPTADKNKALGTGKYDAGFTVELSEWFGKWNTFAETGYTVQERSTSLALKNYATYNAGIGYQVSEAIRPVLLIKGETPPTANSSSLMEARLKLNYQITHHTGVDAYIARGLTSSSLDYGTGLSVYYEF